MNLRGYETVRYQIEPDVVGEWGDDVDYDPAREPRLVGPFHYVLDSWTGEDLVTTHPFFFVTRRLEDAIMAAELTGVEFVLVTVSSEGWATPARPELPELAQLDFTGGRGQRSVPPQQRSSGERSSDAGAAGVQPRRR